MWLLRTWLPISSQQFIAKYLKTVLPQKPRSDPGVISQLGSAYTEFVRVMEDWQKRYKQATNPYDKEELEKIKPKQPDTRGQYSIEYKYYKLAMKYWLAKKDDATCDKEKKKVEDEKPKRPDPPRPEDSEIRDFVTLYLKVRLEHTTFYITIY